MSIEAIAEAEGVAISKSRHYRTRHPRKTRASLKAVPAHMRAGRKEPRVEPQPLIPKNTMSQALRDLLNGK